MIEVIAQLVIITTFVYALSAKDLLASVIATGVAGMAVAFYFFILQAPDVALAQIVVNAIMLPLFYVLAISETKRMDDEIK